MCHLLSFFFFQAEDGIRDLYVTGVQTCALPILRTSGRTAQGVSSPGSRPPEDEPIRIVNVGHSANAAPAASRVERVPMPTASASRTRPRKPTVTSSDIHSR